jgi:hypothetical protein
LVHVIQQTGNLPLQTKKWEEEAAPPDPEAFIQRICLTCAADDGEEKKAYSIPRAETPVVRRLLGYGLGHVIQLSGRPRAGEGPPDLHATEPSIQRSVWTMGGSWDTIKYDLVRKEGDRDVTGLDISLKFIPEDPVDAELIGLTQTVRPIRKGNPRFVEGSSKRRATRQVNRVSKRVFTSTSLKPRIRSMQPRKQALLIPWQARPLHLLEFR